MTHTAPQVSHRSRYGLHRVPEHTYPQVTPIAEHSAHATRSVAVVDMQRPAIARRSAADGAYAPLFGEHSFYLGRRDAVEPLYQRSPCLSLSCWRPVEAAADESRDLFPARCGPIGLVLRACATTAPRVEPQNPLGIWAEVPHLFKQLARLTSLVSVWVDLRLNQSVFAPISARVSNARLAPRVVALRRSRPKLSDWLDGFTVSAGLFCYSKINQGVNLRDRFRFGQARVAASTAFGPSLCSF